MIVMIIIKKEKKRYTNDDNDDNVTYPVDGTLITIPYQPSIMLEIVARDDEGMI